jgi:hypothetical protein
VSNFHPVSAANNFPVLRDELPARSATQAVSRGAAPTSPGVVAFDVRELGQIWRGLTGQPTGRGKWHDKALTAGYTVFAQVLGSPKLGGFCELYRTADGGGNAMFTPQGDMIRASEKVVREGHAETWFVNTVNIDLNRR